MLTTRGESVDTANPIYKKRGEDVNFNFAFEASDSISWAGLKLRGMLVNSNDVQLWDSGEVSGTVAGDGSASKTITLPDTTTKTLPEGTYYVDFAYWSDTVGITKTKTYLLKIADGPTNLP